MGCPQGLPDGSPTGGAPGKPGRVAAAASCQWVPAAGYGFYVALITADYYYNLTFVQLGLIDLELLARRRELPPETVADSDAPPRGGRC